ncbi:hypothetical protein [Actinopolymorpha pittospori]|uniref:Ig-like domain (Group 3) n=1 Tax=Actinopolymorpha pittospori TaxID=648752 RepID=A0A927MZ81_9ACTN|nr:hypothetical protein [Actinopolymorpha pittospori]MBE1609279.1 hypothetical protein [Actinopolymorpha pittospori]
MSQQTRRTTRVAAAALVLAGLPAILFQGSALAAPEDRSTAVASGDDWSVTRVAGGFQVTLDLDRTLPVTASAPTLSVDGVDLGPAVESADGRSLTLVTADPSVADANAVTTDAFGVQTNARQGTPATPRAKKPAPPITPRTLRADPAKLGSYHVSEATYAFGDQALPLLNFGGIRGEFEGKIYLPDGTGEKPVVILLHGRHSSCYGPGAANPARWPCLATPDSTEQRWSIPSYLGYDAPARALASNGYAVVSVSANAINANDNQLAADYGAQARGELILDTLRMLKKANAGQQVVYHDAFTDQDVSLGEALDGDIRPSDLVRRLDLDDVGIMGHSRGGEGVVAASNLNDALPVAQQFGIKAVLPLAPVDYNRMSLPNAATATILPYCDGDVENLMGQHIVDDSRHNFDDNVLRSTVLVMGTNHNFFNTIWTPGGWPSGTADDWVSGASGADDPVCAPTAADTTRLTAPEQVEVGTAYMAGFFRLVLGDEKEFQPLFDGSDVIAPSTPFADVKVVATQPAKSRVDINTFERTSSAVRLYGGATADVCASMAGLAVPQTMPYCSTTLNQAALPHWSPALWSPNTPSSPMLHVRWTSGDGEVRVSVPAKARNVNSYDQISVKMAADEFVATGTDVTVSVLDGSGHTWSALVSDLNPDAVTRMPGVNSPWLRKVILQQVTIPTSWLSGLDRKDIREVRFTAAPGADGTESGGVYLSDLSAERRTVGARVPARQATVDVAPANVEEAAGPGTAKVAAVLSRPVDHPVSAYVSVFGAATGKAGLTMSKVTFTPGQVCVPVAVPTYGDTLPSATPSTSFKVSATNVAGAVMGDNGLGTLTVREDDGVVGGTPAPEVGMAGDACREYAATLTPGKLKVNRGSVRVGETMALTAGGYRSGESVEFLLGSTSLGRAVADRQGTVSYVASVPSDVTVGKTPVTAVGAGSRYTTETEVTVRAGHGRG